MSLLSPKADEVILRTELAGLLDLDERGEEVRRPRTRPLCRPDRFLARKEDTGELTLVLLPWLVVVVCVWVLSFPSAFNALSLSKEEGRFFFGLWR